MTDSALCGPTVRVTFVSGVRQTRGPYRPFPFELLSQQILLLSSEQNIFLKRAGETRGERAVGE